MLLLQICVRHTNSLAILWTITIASPTGLVWGKHLNPPAVWLEKGTTPLLGNARNTVLEDRAKILAQKNMVRTYTTNSRYLKVKIYPKLLISQSKFSGPKNKQNCGSQPRDPLSPQYFSVIRRLFSFQDNPKL